MVIKKSSAVASKQQDLVFLVWPVNARCIHLQAKVPKGVSLDLQEGTWTFRGKSFPIGEQDQFSFIGQTGAPLGCYDRTKFNHLVAFQDAIEWVANRGRPSFDD